MFSGPQSARPAETEGSGLMQDFDFARRPALPLFFPVCLSSLGPSLTGHLPPRQPEKVAGP